MTEADIRRIVREEIERARPEIMLDFEARICAASSATVQRALNAMQDRVARGRC